MATAVLVFDGEYDVNRVEELRDEFRHLSDVPKVVLDFREVRFIDSTCIGEVMRLQAVRQANKLDEVCILLKAGTAIQRLFDILGLAFQY